MFEGHFGGGTYRSSHFISGRKEQKQTNAKVFTFQNQVDIDMIGQYKSEKVLHGKVKGRENRFSLYLLNSGKCQVECEAMKHTGLVGLSSQHRYGKSYVSCHDVLGLGNFMTN